MSNVFRTKREREAAFGGPLGSTSSNKTTSSMTPEERQQLDNEIAMREALEQEMAAKEASAAEKLRKREMGLRGIQRELYRERGGGARV